MNCILYMSNSTKISIFEQHNICNEKAKRYGYSITQRIFDMRSDRFTETINKIVADENIKALIIYDKDTVFMNNDDYVFYKIYLDKLGKQLITCN